MSISMKEVTLENVADGVSTELFSHELAKIAANIADLNTKAKVKRSITMTFSFLPGEEREEISLAVTAVSKLAPVKECAKTIHFGKQNGKATFFEQNVKQLNMFDENVAQIKKEAGNA